MPEPRKKLEVIFHAAKELMSSGFDELRRRIREEEPAKPSTRLGTMKGAQLKTVAKQRRCEVYRLTSLLRGDLDWIVMKCLEKDRNRRYDTANGLAMDLKRHLSNELVTARPPSTAYKMQKAWRRNRLAYASIMAIAASLVVGFGFSLWQRNEALEAQAQAELERQEAERQKRRAESVSYASQIRLASNRLDRGETLVARRDLLAMPSEFRNWEWGLLVNQAWPTRMELNPVFYEPGMTAAEYWATAPADVIVKRDHNIQIRVNAFGMTTDGERLITGMGDGSLRTWDLRTGKSLNDFPKLPMITGVRFNHDNTRLAVGDVSGGIFLLDADSKTQLWAGQLQGTQVVSFWFRPSDNARLVASDTAGIVGVWDTDSGDQIRKFTGHPGAEVESLRFFPDGKSVITASRDGSIRVWELDTGRIIEAQSTPFHGGVHASVVKISPDRRQVAVGYWDGTLILWDRANGERRHLFECDGQIYGLSFSHDGTCLFVVESVQLISVLDLSGNPLNRLMSDGSVGADEGELTVQPADDTRFAICSKDGTIRVWAPVQSESDRRRVLTDAHDDVVLQAAYSPNGRRIVTASYDKTARIWDATTQELILTLAGHDDELLKAEFSPDGSYVATLDRHGSVRVWDAETGGEVGSAATDSDAFYRSISAEGGLRGQLLNFSAVFSSSPFFQTGMVVNDGNEMAVIDHTNGRRLRTLKNNPMIGWPVIDPRGKLVATITDALKDVHLWDLATGEKLHVLGPHEDFAYWAEFSPDGLRVVTGSMAGKAIVWDVRTGEPLVELPGSDYVAAARFSSNGERIAVASADRTVKIWDASTGELLTTFYDHSFRLSNVEFSPDGTRVLSTAGGTDSTVRVWDPNEPDARELVQFTRDAKLVYATWSPDGRQILTCWDDGAVHLLEAFPWDQSIDDLVAMSDRVRQ